MAGLNTVLYDGNCNFCSFIVNFLKQKDLQKKLNFIPVQQVEARKILRQRNEAFVNLMTIYFVTDQEVYKKSRAVFNILKLLPSPYKYLSLLRFIPRFITDHVYDLVAKYRFRIMGVKELV